VNISYNDGPININDVFGKDTHYSSFPYDNEDVYNVFDDINEIKLLHCHITSLCQRTGKDVDGMKFYIVLPEEFKAYCAQLGLRVMEMRKALKAVGQLYLERDSECTRNCRINGKQQRCICVYADKA